MKITTPDGAQLPVVCLDFETYYATDYTLSKLTTTAYIRDPRFRAHGASIRSSEDDAAYWVSHDDLPHVLGSIDWSKTALLCHNTAFDGLILSHHYGQVAKYYLDTLSMSRGDFGVHVPHSLDQLAKRLGVGEKIKGTLESTMGLAELPKDVEEQLLVYANMDVDLTWRIFETLYYDRGYPEKELHVIDLTLRAYVDPVIQIDTALCYEERDAEIENKSKLVKEAGVPVGTLMSNQQFAALIEAQGIEVPMKISPTTGKPTFAFAKSDEGFRELGRDPRVASIVQARLAVKSTINETRAQRFIEHSDPAFPVFMNYCGAHTHRWSAGDKTNIQNLPSGRAGQSDRLRRSLLAPEGHVLVVVDSAQIEARTLAWAAEEEEILTVFRNNGDPYGHMATKIYQHPVTKSYVLRTPQGYLVGDTIKNVPYWEATTFKHAEDLDPFLEKFTDSVADKTLVTERNVGKTAVLGLGYGMGAKKFCATCITQRIDMDEDSADHIVRIYRRSNSRIVKLWDTLDDILGKMYREETVDHGPWSFRYGYARMPNGLDIHYPDLSRDETEYGYAYRYNTRNGWSSLYGGKFAENLIQSTARTIVAEQALAIAKRYRVVSLVHDEVIFIAEEKEADNALAYGLECMSLAPAWCAELPVAAEGGYARNYSK